MSNKLLHEQLSKIYNYKLEKTGVVLTINQLYQLGQKNQIFGLTKKKVGDFLRTKTEVARFANNTAKRPAQFQSIGVPVSGIFFIDYAEFHKNWASPLNRGYTGFLVAVENLTNKLFVYPCRGKSSNEWESAVQKFIEQTGYVRTIYSDRDAVATSSTFREKMKQLYNVRWHFLVKGSKSYLAERYIRYMKEKLSQTMAVKKTKTWYTFVKAITDEYNNEKIAGTSYKRKSILPSNFYHFMSQLIKVEEPELLFSGSKINEFLTKTWNQNIFKFSIGDQVLLARRSDWSKKLPGGPSFFKPSQWGTFGEEIYTIGARQLRATKKLNQFVPVYSLKEIGPSVHFYTNELKKL